MLREPVGKLHQTQKSSACVDVDVKAINTIVNARGVKSVCCPIIDNS